MRGDGRIYRDPGSRFWYTALYVNGRQVRESTGTEDEQKALRVLRKRMAEALQGGAIPHENKVTLGALLAMIETDYAVHQRRSQSTLPYPLRHLRDHFGESRKAVTITSDHLDRYILARQAAGAAVASIRIELALLSKGFTLAVRARKLRTKPYIPKPEGDPSRVRAGFFTREEVEALCEHLDVNLADTVTFLFFSAWRVGEVRTLQWRDYDRHEQTIRLRPEHSKNKHGRILPLVGELAAILDRRVAARRLDCPYIFHRNGQAIGDFRKLWQRALTAIGLAGRLVHDLRRSGVKHLIDSGIDPHTVMAFSGHRTPSMLRRYHIIDLDDLRRAAAKASAHRADSVAPVTPLAARTRRERAE
jgi:integrase